MKFMSSMTRQADGLPRILMIVLVLVVFMVARCGKQVNLGSSSSSSSASTSPNDIAKSCDGAHQKHWQFIQPQATANTAVDVLFVVDTSSSLDDERARVAQTLPDFVAHLSANADYRIGVMLAHGGASQYSGRLYAARNVPKVLSSQDLSTAQIQSDLKKTLGNIVADVDEANGEAMLYSLQNGLSASHLSESRGLGFFRDSAALSIVFLSDENDICFRPELRGYTGFPDYVPSIGNIESVADQKYCAGVTFTNVISSVRQIKGTHPIAFAAITHIDPARVPQGATLEDSIGHGLIELVQATPDGVLLDIGDASYSSGLTKLADVVSTNLNLRTVFQLSDSSMLISQSVGTLVDGKSISSRYNSNTGTVAISGIDAGRAGSLVEVQACAR